MDMQLADKVVMVTGATRGVGLGISKAFLGAGARVIAGARTEPDSPTTVGENSANFYQLDVRDPDAINAFFAAVEHQYGALDVLVNNAGGSPFAEAASASPRFSERIIQLNLLAPLNMAQAANRMMQSREAGGVIINIASVSGQRPSPGTAAYGAAKAGLINLTGSLAVEWAPRVRCNAIVAGLIETEQSALHYGDAEGIAAVARTIPLQRLGTPADIGNLCLWLASPLSSYLSGACISAHGGGERPAFLDAATANRSE